MRHGGRRRAKNWQKSSSVAEVGLGYHDIARAFVDFYHSRIPQMQEMTRRIYRSDGVVWAWEFPISPESRQLADGSPNAFQYEIHNAAYPARMASETAEVLQDAAWAKKVAWPVILESTRFFLSNLKKEGATWSLHVTPSMGQDEYGGENAKNYLCALFAVLYCLRTALHFSKQWKCELPEADLCQTIVADGLAFPTIYRADLGVYATSGNPGYQLGKEKHPVQLDPLWLFPTDTLDAPTLHAYAIRHQLCQNPWNGLGYARPASPFYIGWTLPAMWASSARMQDADGLAEDWKKALPSQLVDPDYISIYESSGYWYAYFTSSMGIFVCAVLEAASSPKAWPKTWGERPLLS